MIENRHYVVLQQNRWGAAKNLKDAMDNAGVKIFSLMDSCIDAIEYSEQDELKTELYANFAHHEPDDPIDFVVIVTDYEIWKFTRCNEIDGSPLYKYLGEGERPKGVETETNKFTLHGSGKITLRD